MDSMMPFFQEVELRRVELLSALGIITTLIHRFSFSYPRSGNRPLSRTMGFSGISLSQSADQRQPHEASVGGWSSVLNGVKLWTLEPVRGC